MSVDEYFTNTSQILHDNSGEEDFKKITRTTEDGVTKKNSWMVPGGGGTLVLLIVVCYFVSILFVCSLKFNKNVF